MKELNEKINRNMVLKLELSPEDHKRFKTISVGERITMKNLLLKMLDLYETNKHNTFFES